MLDLKEIEKYVSKGFVLDWSGNWRSINDVVEEESDYLHHLENGEIVYKGSWMKIDEVLKVGLQEEDSKHKRAEKDMPPGYVDTKVLHRKEGKVSDEEENVLLNEMREVVGNALKIDIDQIPAADEEASQKEIEKQKREKKVREIEDGAEKETREIKVVKQNQKTEVQSDGVEEDVESIDEVLPEEEQRDNRERDTKFLKVAEVEKAHSQKSKPPDKKKSATSEVQSEWDKARSIKSKLIILPIVGVILIVVIIILMLL